METGSALRIFAKKTLQKSVDKYTWHMYNKDVKKTWQKQINKTEDESMNREEILAKAQKETDERELVIRNTAYKYASEVMGVFVAVMALGFVVDGYLLENVRQVGSAAIGTAMAGLYCIYGAVYEGYTGYHLKNRMNIIGCIVMFLAGGGMIGLFLSNIF